MPGLAPSPLESLDDASLAHRVAARDTAAFEVLMRRHNRPLFRAARSILKNDADAEDVVQETYLLAYRRIAAFRGEAKLSTWLIRIAVNESLARARRARRRGEVIALEDAMFGRERPDGTAPGAERPEEPDEVAHRAEVRRLIERRIDALPEAFRAVFVLRALEDLTVEETALALGVPEATVRTRYFRARGLLREALAREVDLTLETAFGFDGARCDRIVERVLARVAGARTDAP